MEKNKTTTDVAIFIVFNLIFSIIVGYVTSCLVLHSTYPDDHRIFVSLRTICIKSYALINNNSGGWINNPGADVFIYGVVGFILSSMTLLIIFRNTNKRKNELAKFKSTIHGDSYFATLEEIIAKGLTARKSGVVLCKFNEKGDR